MSPIKEAIEAQTELVDQVCDALIQAWTLGQYYHGYNDRDDQLGAFKAQETHTKFVALLDKTRAALAALRSMPAEPVAWVLYFTNEHGTPMREPFFSKAHMERHKLHNETMRGLECRVEPLYTTPPPAPVLSDAEERAEFEAWAVSEDAELDVTMAHNTTLGISGYLSTNTFKAWQAWRAGRASRGAK